LADTNIPASLHIDQQSNNNTTTNTTTATTTNDTITQQTSKQALSTLNSNNDINHMSKHQQPILVEIGPRFVLNPIRIFNNSFSGSTLWTNPHYVSPNAKRATMKLQYAEKYNNKVLQKIKGREHQNENIIYSTEVEDVFQNSNDGNDDAVDDDDNANESDSDDHIQEDNNNILDDVIISDDSSDE